MLKWFKPLILSYVICVNAQGAFTERSLRGYTNVVNHNFTTPQLTDILVKFNQILLSSIRVELQENNFQRVNLKENKVKISMLSLVYSTFYQHGLKSLRITISENFTELPIPPCHHSSSSPPQLNLAATAHHDHSGHSPPLKCAHQYTMTEALLCSSGCLKHLQFTFNGCR